MQERAAQIQSRAIKRLRCKRQVDQLSAADLAERCAKQGTPELDRSAIANIENGRRRRLGLDELLVLCEALGVRAEDVLSDEPVILQI